MFSDRPLAFAAAVVVVDGLAASGGYIAAMASDQIVAKQSAIVVAMSRPHAAMRI